MQKNFLKKCYSVKRKTEIKIACYNMNLKDIMLNEKGHIKRL